MRGFAIRLAFLAAALLALPPAALADREAAEFHAEKGEKALKAGDTDSAGESFRKSLEEDGTFHPARFGLARALIATGRPSEGLEELRRFIAEMKAEVAPPPAWGGRHVRANRMFEEMDAASAEIAKVVDRYADSLVALGKKWKEKDPLVAERALRRALKLRPGDKAAVDLLAVVDSIPKGKPIDLFNGADFSGWLDAELPYFRVDSGAIVADVERGSRQIRSAEALDGDYDISVEARVVSESGNGDPMVSLLAALKGTYDFVGVGLINRKVYFFDRLTEKDRRILYKGAVEEWGHPLDLTAWNTYALQFRREEITALINGMEVGKHPRAPERAEGFVGLYAQGAKVEFRKVRLQRY